MSLALVWSEDEAALAALPSVLIDNGLLIVITTSVDELRSYVDAGRAAFVLAGPAMADTQAATAALLRCERVVPFLRIVRHEIDSPDRLRTASVRLDARLTPGTMRLALETARHVATRGAAAVVGQRTPERPRTSPAATARRSPRHLRTPSGLANTGSAPKADIEFNNPDGSGVQE